MKEIRVYYLKKGNGSDRAIHTPIVSEMMILKEYGLSFKQYSSLTYAQKRLLYYYQVVSCFNKSVEQDHAEERAKAKSAANNGKPQGQQQISRRF